MELGDLKKAAANFKKVLTYDSNTEKALEALENVKFLNEKEEAAAAEAIAEAEMAKELQNLKIPFLEGLSNDSATSRMM